MTLSAIALGVAVTFPARADEVSDLKAAIERMAQEMEALKARQAQLEARPAAAPVAPVNDPSGTPSKAEQKGIIREGDVPGSFKFPGTNTSVRIGGYADLTVTKDFNQNEGGNFIIPGGIPLPGSANYHRQGQFYMSARRSKLDVSTITPNTRLGDVKTVIQGDFYGAGGTETATNSYGFRLRLAYANVGNWTIGQDWSTFSEGGSAIDILDFGGGIGAPTAPRQPQVRYQLPIGTSSNIAFAVENPESDVFGVAATQAPAGIGTVPTQTIDKYPDLVARYVTTGNWGRFSAAALWRRIGLNNEGAAAVGGYNGEQLKTGSGFMVQGLVNTFGNDNITYAVMAGDGIGRYLLGAMQSSYLDPDDRKLKLIFSKGASVAYQHFWTPELRSSLVWMGVNSNAHHSAAEGGIPLTQIHREYEMLGNLIWQPTPLDFFGLEASQTNVWADGAVAPITSDHTHAKRLQFDYRRLF